LPVAARRERCGANQIAASSPLAPFGWSKSGCCLLLAALAGYCMAATGSSQKQLPADQPNTVLNL